jgi:lipoprotein-anchoring transpeptidase ErfK/SrfK
MRQFLMGLAFAAIVWWGYSAWFSKAPPVNGAETGGQADLNSFLAATGLGAAPENGQGLPTHGSPPGTAGKAGDAAAPAAPPASTSGDHPLASGNAPEAAALESLVQGIQKGDARAIAVAWQFLAQGGTPAAQRQQVLIALAGLKAEDPQTALAHLGENNAFLHSAEGREAGGIVLRLCAGQPDDKAVTLMTDLLDRCMRGPIQKSDTEEHAFVDAAWALAKKHVDRFVCDPANVARARSYTVAPHDVLAKIAAKFRREEKIFVDAGTLALLNRIQNPNLLKAGQKIKIPVDPIHVVIEKRSFLMGVYLGDVLLRLYWVGHGADDKTPVTEFTVELKQPNPDWYSPEGPIPFGKPGNILGKYFVRLHHDSYTGFGIHGTTMPETVGTMCSMGCIRMLDNDIEEFFNIIPVGAKVAVRDSH